MSRTASFIAMSALAAAFALAPATADAQNKRFKSGNSAPASGGSGGEGLLKIQVCNRSRDSASVALSFMEPGDTRFINRGWFTVRAGECKILGQTDNATFYGYADVNGTDRFWGGDHSLCVEYPGPYTFYTSRTGYCSDDQVTRDFVTMTATQAGTYTWNLDP